MTEEKRFLVDVGMKNLPFPIRVESKLNRNGQATVCDISIEARIMREFEARWIDSFIQIVHQHRDRIGTKTLKENIKDYLEKLKASVVKIDFDYPFFIEKLTPVTKEKCLVRYMCTYSVKASAAMDKVPGEVGFKIQVPVLTTYPTSSVATRGGLFAQLSVISVEITSPKNIYPEDIVDIVDRHALSPVYSFLTERDQEHIIHKVHNEKKTSVVTVDEIKDELARNRDIESYIVRSSNYGMLHTYSTVIETIKSAWVPFSDYAEEEEI